MAGGINVSRTVCVLVTLAVLIIPVSKELVIAKTIAREKDLPLQLGHAAVFFGMLFKIHSEFLYNRLFIGQKMITNVQVPGPHGDKEEKLLTVCA